MTSNTNILDLLAEADRTTVISFNPNTVAKTGNTHANYNFKTNGERITISGRCEATKSIITDGTNINIPNKIPNSPYIEMPDFSELVKQQAKNAGQYYIGDKTLNASNLNLNYPIYATGKVTINGSNFTGKGCIVAEGEIVINGQDVSLSTKSN